MVVIEGCTCSQPAVQAVIQGSVHHHNKTQGIAEEKIIRIAKESGAEAIHPGYGFLAENAEFAERVEAAGLTWVGPPPDAMRVMGSKTESRKLAKSAGAPVIAGLMEPITDISELEAFADEHGFPVLLKAVAGGGGKGMRVVAERDELAGSYERACSEGLAYFGDDRVYVERLVDSPRHIEVQVVAAFFQKLTHPHVHIWIAPVSELVDQSAMIEFEYLLLITTLFFETNQLHQPFCRIAGRGFGFKLESHLSHNGRLTFINSYR